MGQLELQDCFAPYFDPKQEIEVKNPAPKRPAQSPRAKSAISMPGMAAISRKAKPPQGATKPPSGNQQMK
jgi:hypothetical protein